MCMLGGITMVSRNKILKKIENNKLDFDLYRELAQVLIAENDRINYFKVSITNDDITTKLINDLVYTILQKVDIEALVYLYPLYLIEHAHFFIFSNKFKLDDGIFNKVYMTDMVQKNEWEKNEYEYVIQLHNYMNKRIENRYTIYLEKKLDFKQECPQKVSIEEYIHWYKKTYQNHMNIFDDLMDCFWQEVEINV